MTRPSAFVSLALPWVLWAHLETQSVPARGVPFQVSEIVERFEDYRSCEKAAAWVDSQPDLREEWTTTKDGKRYHTTMQYECRQQ